MKAQRWVLRLIYSISLITATIMAWVPGFAESFSQNDLDAGDPWLRAFLTSVAVAEALRAGWANNRWEHFTFFRWRIQWWQLYVFNSLAFAAISVTNVEQITIWHFIFTGLGAAGKYVEAWNYFKDPTERLVAIISITVGTLWFVASLLLGFTTVARGEWAFTVPAYVIAWVQINETIREQ